MPITPEKDITVDVNLDISENLAIERAKTFK